MNVQDSRTISLLRFPMTLAVVIQHSMGTISTSINWDNLSGYDFYSLFKVLCSGTIALVAVPTFFFISGYLFFNKIAKMDIGVYKSKITKRFGSLVVPYVLWNILCIPMMFAVMYGEVWSGTRAESTINDFINNSRWEYFLWSFTSGDAAFDNIFGWHQLKQAPILSTFWFVRDLIIMSLLSPLIWWYVKKTKVWGLAFLFAIYVFRIWPHITLGSQALFFVFGAYWSINGKSLTINSKVVKYSNYALTAIVLIALVCLLGNYTYWGAQLAPLFTLTGFFTLISLTSGIAVSRPAFKFPELLTSSSFFVYALHIEFALPMGFFICKTLFRGTANPALLTLQYIITPCVIYAICLATYICMKKICPKFLSLLNGSR